MLGIKKFFVLLFSLILLISLTATGLFASIVTTFDSPTKIETWLNQSGLEGDFTSKVASQAGQVLSGYGTSANIQSELNQAAQSAFPAADLQQDVDTIINSNYAWLNGKTTIPEFRINLAYAKQTFAYNIGQYIQTKLTALPACSVAQTEQLQTTNPFSLTCRPIGTTPSTIASQVTAQVENNDSVLTTPVISASSLNPTQQNQGTPYYVKLSKAPKYYSLVKKLPWLLAIVSLICAAIVLFASKRKRSGLRNISVVLVLSGLVLIAIKFVADTVTNKVQTSLLKHSGVSSFQSALTSLIHKFESSMTKTDFHFGIGYLVLAILIILLLVSTKHRKPKVSTKPTEEEPDIIETDGPRQAPSTHPMPQKPAKNPLDIVGTRASSPVIKINLADAPSNLRGSPKNKSPKKRLIQ